MGVSLPRFPPLWREGRAGVEAAALFRELGLARGWRADGDGRPVLLIPGFMAGDGSMATMTRWLRENGYRTHRAGIRAQRGLLARNTCTRLEARLEQLFAERTGQRVAILGQSRGGVFARVPGGPPAGPRERHRDPRLTHRPAAQRASLRARPGALSSAPSGPARCPGCSASRASGVPAVSVSRADLANAFPEQVGFTALYSKTDGVVDWRACLDPAAAEQVQVRASHLGMGLNVEVYAEVGNAPGRFVRDDGPVSGDKPPRGEPHAQTRALRPSGAPASHPQMKLKVQLDPSGKWQACRRRLARAGRRPSRPPSAPRRPTTRARPPFRQNPAHRRG